jgi:O-methyltransferase involved in polyketide biosynthesis
MGRSVQLGRIQETALVPLYARALETRRKRPLLVDPKAVEIVVAQPRRMAGCVLRGALFDVWVRLVYLEEAQVKAALEQTPPPRR